MISLKAWYLHVSLEFPPVRKENTTSKVAIHSEINPLVIGYNFSKRK